MAVHSICECSVMMYHCLEKFKEFLILHPLISNLHCNQCTMMQYIAKERGELPFQPSPLSPDDPS